MCRNSTATPTAVERNERLGRWVQAVAQVAVVEQTGKQLDNEYMLHIGELFASGTSERANDYEIAKLNKLAEHRGVAPPFVETRSEAKAAMIMNVTCEEIAGLLFKGEREFMAERQQGQELNKQQRQEWQQQMDDWDDLEVD